MSLKISALVWESARVRGPELLVLLALADYANDEGYCWPSVSSIATKVRLSRRQVFVMLQRLEKLRGLLHVQSGAGQYQQNVYRIVAEKIVKPMQDSTPLQESTPVKKTVAPVKLSVSSGEESFTQTIRTVSKKQRSEKKRRIALPSWLPLEAWNDFVEMRRQKKSAMTAKAMELAIKKLDGFRADGESVVDILNEATMRGWSGLFSLKSNQRGNRNGSSQGRSEQRKQGNLAILESVNAEYESGQTSMDYTATGSAR